MMATAGSIRQWFGTASGAVFALGVSSLLLTSACGGPAPAKPRAAIVSSLGAGQQQGSTMACPLGIGMSWISIGDDTSQPISDGTKYNGAPVSVTCTVHGTGDGFNVTLVGEVRGQGSISVSNATISNDTTQVNQNISANFSSATISGAFVEHDCTWDFGGQTTDFNPSGSFGIAAGRIWGNLACPMVVNSEANDTCVAAAEMRFENCGE